MATDLNEDEILQILKIIDESNFDELSLETDNLKLVLKKSGGASSIQELRNVTLRQIPLDSTKPVASEENVPFVGHKESPAVTRSPAPLEDGLVPVKAPVMGIFYRSPSPKAPRFVEEGTSVTENDRVCIIEVMKVFNSVAAGVRGVVVKVCAENGQLVEFGQTLFLIRPDGEQEAKSEA
ncbi:MAG: biotin/lipoyl-containing protein [Deltaproteobacteria bacterium]